MSTRNKIAVAIFALLLTTSAHSDGIYNPKSNAIGVTDGVNNLALGSSTPAPPLTNLRITNSGAFRITSAGSNRAVSP